MGEKINPSENWDEDVDLIAHLRQARFEWSDEIPDRILHSTDQKNKFKVRKNWWQGIIADLDNIQNDGLLSSEMCAKVESFFGKYTNPDFVDRLTTAEDIAEANALIDEILATVENEKKE